MDQCRSQGFDQKDIKWSPLKGDTFIEIMKEQQKLGRTIPSGFSTQGWKAITDKMIECFGHEFTQDKLESRFKSLEKTYDMMKMMFNLSGFGWDPVKKSVTAEPAVWDEFLTTYPDASHYKDKIMPDYFSLSLIFGDTVADVRDGYAANEAVPDMQDVLSVQDDFAEEHFSSVASSAPHEAKPCELNTKSRARGKNIVGMQMVNAIHAVAASILEVARKLPKPRPSMEDCIEAVEQLNLDRESEYITIRHLENDKKAHTFMALKPEKRLMWLQYELNIH